MGRLKDEPFFMRSSRSIRAPDMRFPSLFCCRCRAPQHPTCGSPACSVAGAERPNTGRTLLNMLRLRQPACGSTMTNSCLCRNSLRRCGTNVTKFNRRRVLDSTDGRAPASTAGLGGRRATPSPQGLHANMGRSVCVCSTSLVTLG